MKRVYSVQVVPIRFIVHNCDSKVAARATVEIFGRERFRYKIKRLKDED